MSGNEEQTRSEGEQADPLASSSASEAEADEGQAAVQPAREEPPPGLSKNQLKKWNKRIRLHQFRLERRAAAKAERQAQRTQQRAETERKLTAMSEEERTAWREQRAAARQERDAKKEERRAAQLEAAQSGQAIVIDLDFDGFMTDNELRSLVQQLGYCYCAATRGPARAHLHLLGATGGVARRMEAQSTGLTRWAVTRSEAPYHEFFADRKGDLVYLTADATEELTELDSSKVYVIGGVVDRNRHKGECLRRANEQGVATARLPIGAHLKLAGSCVLTVNQVVEILVGWLADRDWGKVLTRVLPGRKVEGFRGGSSAAGTATGAAAGAAADAVAGTEAVAASGAAAGAAAGATAGAAAGAAADAAADAAARAEADAAADAAVAQPGGGESADGSLEAGGGDEAAGGVKRTAPTSAAVEPKGNAEALENGQGKKRCLDR